MTDDPPPAQMFDTGAVELPDGFFASPVADRRKLIGGLANRRTGEPTLGNHIRQTFIGGDPRVIPALTAAVEHDTDVHVQRSALLGLTRATDRAAIPGLLRGLKSDDHASCWHAINGLQALKAREAVPDLITLLERRRLRTKAAGALVAIRDERALAPLRAAAKRGWPTSRRTLREHAAALARAVGG